MAYVWGAIIGGVIVSSLLSKASGDQPVLVGALGAIAGLFVVHLLRGLRRSNTSGSEPTRTEGPGTDPSVDRRQPMAAPRANDQASPAGDAEMSDLIALADRLAGLFPGWDARITQFSDSLRVVQIDHYPGVSTMLFALVDDAWVALSLLLDSSGEPIPGGPAPAPLGTRRDQLTDTVARIVAAEVDAYRRAGEPDSALDSEMQNHAAWALRFLTTHR